MKRVLAALKILISVGILWYLFAKAKKEGQFTELFSGDKNWGWFALAILFCFAFHVIGFVRWYWLAHAMQLPLKFKDAIRIGFIGQFFGFFAFGVIGGDSLRAFYASRGGPKKAGKAIASVFFDRVLGLISMMAFAGVWFFLANWSGMVTSTNAKIILALKSASLFLLVASLLGFAFVISAMFISELMLMRAYELSLRVPLVGEILGTILKAIRMLRIRPSAIFVSIGLSSLCNILIIANIYAVANFVGGSHPGFWEHWLISPIAMIGNSLPLPGGLGGMEMALDVLYRAITASTGGKDTGVVVGFLFRFVLLLVSAVGAIMWLTMSAGEKKTIKGVAE